MSSLFVAPLCPEPPEAPSEGRREYLPLSIPLLTDSLCAVNSEEIFPVCPTFLNIYITNVTYGRSSEAGKKLCDGNKPKDIKKPSQDCFDETINQAVKDVLVQGCHGGFNCSVTIPTIPFGINDCDGMKREARVEYICGEFYKS